MLNGESLFDRKITTLGELVARSARLQSQPAAVQRAMASVADITWQQAVQAYRCRHDQDQPYEVFEAIGYLVARSSRAAGTAAE